MQKIKRFHDHVEIESKSVVENVKDIIETLEDSVDSLALFVESGIPNLDPRRDPDVQENLRLGGSYRLEVSLSLSKEK